MALRRPYETMLLVDPRLDSAQVDALLERFSELVAQNGGEVGEIERWGRRRLAYEINDLQEAYYAVVNYELAPEARKPIEEALPFVEGLVRSKTVNPQPRTRRVRS